MYLYNFSSKDTDNRKVLSRAYEISRILHQRKRKRHSEGKDTLLPLLFNEFLSVNYTVNSKKFARVLISPIT